MRAVLRRREVGAFSLEAADNTSVTWNGAITLAEQSHQHLSSEIYVFLPRIVKLIPSADLRGREAYLNLALATFQTGLLRADLGPRLRRRHVAFPRRAGQVFLSFGGIRGRGDSEFCDGILPAEKTVSSSTKSGGDFHGDCPLEVHRGFCTSVALLMPGFGCVAWLIYSC